MKIHDLSQDEFAALARKTPMRDVGGRLTPGEKSGLACLGERWVLLLLDPETLLPRPGKPKKHGAIIYTAINNDVVDGRHRRQRALLNETPVSAWVGLDSAQYQRWKETGSWIENTPKSRKTLSR